MKIAKQIQIPESFFLDVLRLLGYLQDYELDNDTLELCKSLEGQIEAKLNAMKKRESFTAYKTAKLGSEREENRKAYLDAAEIHKDWRTTKEKPF